MRAETQWADERGEGGPQSARGGREGSDCGPARGGIAAAEDADGASRQGASLAKKMWVPIIPPSTGPVLSPTSTWSRK